MKLHFLPHSYFLDVIEWILLRSYEPSQGREKWEYSRFKIWQIGPGWMPALSTYVWMLSIAYKIYNCLLYALKKFGLRSSKECCQLNGSSLGHFSNLSFLYQWWGSVLLPATSNFNLLDKIRPVNIRHSQIWHVDVLTRRWFFSSDQRLTIKHRGLFTNCG